MLMVVMALITLCLPHSRLSIHTGREFCAQGFKLFDFSGELISVCELAQVVALGRAVIVISPNLCTGIQLDRAKLLGRLMKLAAKSGPSLLV